MHMFVKKIIHRLITKPRNLFLIDSIGAMLTALAMFIVLTNFNQYFGIPKISFTYLSAIAACFCLYSMFCFLFLRENFPPFIRIISIANILYCILITGFLIQYNAKITNLGLAYFFGEITIICILVFIELIVANKIKLHEHP